jgi:hypothetical protein
LIVLLDSEPYWTPVNCRILYSRRLAPAKEHVQALQVGRDGLYRLGVFGPTLRPAAALSTEGVVDFCLVFVSLAVYKLMSVLEYL